MNDAFLVRVQAPRVLQGPGAVFVFAGSSLASPGVPNAAAPQRAQRAGPPPQVFAFEGDHAALVEAVLESTRAPIGREDLVARILREAGADAARRPAIDAAIDLLLRTGALAVVSKETHPPPDAPAAFGAHVVVCVTGAVGAVYAPPLVERLVASGHQVRVAMTRSARRFITARSFEAITHRPVSGDLFRGTPDTPAPHVELAQWADAVVIYPCTATTLARLAAGDCSELVSAVATTTRAPVLVAPSMNTQMLLAPAVAENLATLRERGMFIAHPAEGVEVADAPRERVRRAGVAAPVVHVVGYVGWLLERAAASGPRLLARVAWDAEHAAHANPSTVEAVDDDMARALESHATPPARVLEVGAGQGAMARAAAAKGYVVVATDFARRALERAEAAAGRAPVTWLVDDVTESALVGTFEVALDRGCLGCIPVARRERYAKAMAAFVRPGGVLVLKVHRSPARQLRAYGFTPDEALALFAPWFDSVGMRDSVLSFGEVQNSAALLLELRRRS